MEIKENEKDYKLEEGGRWSILYLDYKFSLYNMSGEEEEKLSIDDGRTIPFHLSLGFGPSRSPLNGVERGFL